MSDLHDLAMQIRYDLTTAQSKLTELLRQIGELPEAKTTRAVCPICTLEVKGPRTLAEHTHQMHDGPLPEHWQDPPPPPSENLGVPEAGSRPIRQPDPQPSFTP